MHSRPYAPLILMNTGHAEVSIQENCYRNSSMQLRKEDKFIDLCFLKSGSESYERKALLDYVKKARQVGALTAVS